MTFGGNKPVRHGKSRTPTYKIWKGIRQRCSEKSGKNKADYYDRGIRLCERWQDFENFLADMGERPPGMSIERLDNDKGYEPENCKWATPKEQAVNRRNVTILEFDGIKLCIADWAKRIGVSRKGVVKRLKAGWPIEAVLSSTKYVRVSKYV